MNVFKKFKLNNFYLRTILFIIPILEILLNYGIDNDFWFTINQGRYVLNSGFPTTVINTIHSGLSFTYQSYGTGVLYYLIYNLLGTVGIMIFLIIISELISYFFYKLCYLLSNNKKVSYIITIIMITFLSLFFIATRPQIFTYLNLIIILYLLEKYIKSNNKKYLYFIPLIFLLEANMHGIYFIPLLIIICPYIINSFKFNILGIKSEGFNKKPLIITYLISFLVGFINPYTYKTVFYGFSSYTNTLKKLVLELHSPTIHTLTGIIIFILIFGTFFIYYIKKDKRLPLRYYLLIMGTTLMALDAIKSAPFFAICALFPIAYLYKTKETKDNKITKSLIISNSLIIIVTITLSIIFIRPIDNNHLNKPCDFLDKENKIDNPKIYTNFWSGSYLEYRGYNCYIDPRAEVYLKSNNKKVDIINEYYNLQYTTYNYISFLMKYNFDYLVLEKNKDSIYYYLKYYPIEEYNKIYEDNYYQIWQKKDVN